MGISNEAKSSGIILTEGSKKRAKIAPPGFGIYETNIRPGNTQDEHRCALFLKHPEVWQIVQNAFLEDGTAINGNSQNWCTVFRKDGISYDELPIK